MQVCHNWIVHGMNETEADRQLARSSTLYSVDEGPLLHAGYESKVSIGVADDGMPIVYGPGGQVPAVLHQMNRQGETFNKLLSHPFFNFFTKENPFKKQEGNKLV